MTEIEVPDPDEEPTRQDPARRDSADQGDSPYRNLLVPLVVVPAVIVMALVLVFVLFGAIAGEEASPRDNITKVMTGGANESRQAAFNLMRQVLEDLEAQAAGQEGEWGIGPDLAPALQDALEDRLPVEEADEVAIPLALSATLAHLGDERGVLQLCDFLQLDDEIDPEGQFRWQTAMVLGSLGARLDGSRKTLASKRLIELLSDDDHGLRVIGAVALQDYDTPEVATALEGLLNDASLEVRGCAALSLAEQGSPAGSAVLLSMLELGVYEEERAQMPDKWTRAEQVSDSRRRALAALAFVDRLPPDAELERLAEDDPDGSIRELSRTYLARGR